MRDTLLESPYMAARRVFDTALAERVAFVVLAGNILDAELAGPRGTVFLREQFQRLAEAGIAVYWSAGQSDPPEAWPPALPLPENVRVFPQDHAGEFLHPNDGPPLARIVGASRGSRDFPADEFTPDPVGLFSIGVFAGEVDAASLPASDGGPEEIHDVRPSGTDNVSGTGHPLAGRVPAESGARPATREPVLPPPMPDTAAPTRGMHYWALGGRAEPETLFHAPGIVHYPGTPQGRGPTETGPHGCTVVSVDGQGRPRTTFIPTSALEWRRESLSIDTATTREGLEAIFTQRIRSLTQASKCDMLAIWTIGGHGPLEHDSAGESSAGNCWNGCGSSTVWRRPPSGPSASTWTPRTPCRRRCTSRKPFWAISSAGCGNWKAMPPGPWIWSRF